MKQVTALHLAARFTSASVVRVIVEAGAGVRAVDKDYMQTPLHFAAQYNPNADVIIVLVEGGDDNAPPFWPAAVVTLGETIPRIFSQSILACASSTIKQLKT